MMTPEQQHDAKRWLVPSPWTWLISPDDHFGRALYGGLGQSGPEGTFILTDTTATGGVTVTTGRGPDRVTLWHLPYRDARNHRATAPPALLAAYDQTYRDTARIYADDDGKRFWVGMPDAERAALREVRDERGRKLRAIWERQAELALEFLAGARHALVYDMDLIAYAEASS